MADLTNLQLIAEITSRINRPDFDGIARRVSADRIDFYKKECFYGGQATDTSISTAVGTSNYNYPTGFEQVNQIQLLNGSVWLPLAQKHYSYINNIDLVQPGIRSLPALWAPYGSQFRLFPTPNAIYPLELTMDLPPGPPADDATNFWTTAAQSLVINGTCAEICRVYTHDEQGIKDYGDAELREIVSLGSKTIRLRNGIRTRPYL